MEKTIDPAYTGSTKGMQPPYSVANILHIARASAYEFLRSQQDDASVHGGGWEMRELTRLMVHFWTMGYNTVRPSQSSAVSDGYPPIGVTVLNQDNEPVFWGGVNWWSAKLHEWRIVTVTSWRDAVEVDA